LVAVGIMVAGNVSNLFPGVGMNVGAFGLIYIALAAFYFFPAYYLHQFSIKIKQGLSCESLQDVAAGFQNLKSLFKFMGIFTIVILSIYGVILLVALGAGITSAI
jgi:hypothetical protein